MTTCRVNVMLLLIVSALILSGCPSTPHSPILSDVAAVKALLKAGADVNGRDGAGWTPLQRAAEEGNADVVTALIAGGADSEARRGTHDWTALHYAAEEGHGEAVTALIAGGADVNGRDTHGATALHYAALFGKAAVVKALIKGGADVEAMTKDGRPPAILPRTRTSSTCSTADESRPTATVTPPPGQRRQAADHHQRGRKPHRPRRQRAHRGERRDNRIA